MEYRYKSRLRDGSNPRERWILAYSVLYRWASLADLSSSQTGSAAFDDWDFCRSFWKIISRLSHSNDRNKDQTHRVQWLSILAWWGAYSGHVRVAVCIACQSNLFEARSEDFIYRLPSALRMSAGSYFEVWPRIFHMVHCLCRGAGLGSGDDRNRLSEDEV